MKYAIPISEGLLSAHFGQSTEFMIVDADGDGHIAAKKTISTVAHNCGSLPQMLADFGAKVILAGGMGLGPRLAFERNGIEVVLGVTESDPERAVMAHATHKLASGLNACGHADTVCDHTGEHQSEQHESCH